MGLLIEAYVRNRRGLSGRHRHWHLTSLEGTCFADVFTRSTGTKMVDICRLGWPRFVTSTPGYHVLASPEEPRTGRELRLTPLVRFTHHYQGTRFRSHCRPLCRSPRPRLPGPTGDCIRLDARRSSNMHMPAKTLMYAPSSSPPLFRAIFVAPSATLLMNDVTADIASMRAQERLQSLRTCEDPLHPPSSAKPVAEFPKKPRDQRAHHLHLTDHR